MDENKYAVRHPHPGPADLDRTDRRLLGFFAEDSSVSYAEFGGRPNLRVPSIEDLTGARATLLKQRLARYRSLRGEPLCAGTPARDEALMLLGSCLRSDGFRGEGQ